LPERATKAVTQPARAAPATSQAGPGDLGVGGELAQLGGDRLQGGHGVGVEEVERLGEGTADWGSVDAFGCSVSGPVWRRGRLPDEAVHRWAASPDRWWRRAALVSTVPLNLKSRGGTGDAGRTLDICRRLAADRDDMVVKALSWALRELVWDPEAVRRFLDDHDGVLAARVRREVRSKLETGRKHPVRRAT
jgi:3-methyladenine DNA glycosylase AlkD